jgi:hypothetical protein
MITGYKKQKLGKPSEKLSGDVPRAKWRAVIVSEILFPVMMAVIMAVAYMFVKSFPDPDGKQPGPPLLRLAVVALGPLVWNMAVLIAQFIFSLVLGPMFGASFPKFGATMAFVVHLLGTVGMVAFFEFLVCRNCSIHYLVISDRLFCSGSSSFGTSLMPSSVSSPLSQSSERSTRSSSLSFCLVSSSMTRRTRLGGLVGGTAVASARTRCRSRRVSSL